MNTYLISDMHFNHNNIIRYENRPFKDVKEMNNIIIDNWKKVINKDDKVFILGDFGFGSNEEIIKIFNNLRGNKILIMGNHDKRKSINYWCNVGFKEIYKYPIIYDNNFILSHEPLKDVPDNYMNIHGHLHSKNMVDVKKYYNVSCECINYTPINFKIIKDFHNNKNNN